MKISIIMCVMNSMPYIMASIESFNRQKYKNKELIIVHTKSNDNTDEYLNSVNNKNIKKFYFNGKIYKSLNYGIKQAKGDLIGILHSDDIFYSDLTLNHLANKYKANQYDIIYGNILYSDKNNLLKIKRDWSKIKLQKRYDVPPHTGIFLKKKIYNKLKYNCKYTISSDTDFLLRLFSSNYRSYYLNKYTTIMRLGGVSTNFSFLIRKFYEDIKIFNKHNLSFLDYLKKVIFKLNQIFIKKNYKNSKYQILLNNYAKIKIFDKNKFKKINGKIISALNLAFISYNYRFKLLNHNYVFWPDGIFSTYLLRFKKIPGRLFFLKFLKILKKNKKKYKKIFVVGNLPIISKNWLSKNINRPFEHKKFPFANYNDLNYFAERLKLLNNSLIILTLPTPKQELVANKLLSKYPKSDFICIGGSINILSGLEKKSPKIFSILNLEWLWRLRFDTFRRLIRLIESSYFYLKLYISNKNNIF